MKYVNKIIEGIKDFVVIDKSKCIGFSSEQINTIEKEFMQGSKIPKALKEFLMFGGIHFSKGVEPTQWMHFHYFEDFYSDKAFSRTWMRERIFKCLSLKTNEFALAFYHGEGDFAAILRLSDGDDPPVYWSTYAYSWETEDTPTFEIISPCFTDWFINQVIADQKQQRINRAFYENN